MNAQIQDQFDKLDAALNTLISSITSYNPSTAAAEALVEADDKLSQSLDEREHFELGCLEILTFYKLSLTNATTKQSRSSVPPPRPWTRISGRNCHSWQTLVTS